MSYTYTTGLDPLAIKTIPLTPFLRFMFHMEFLTRSMYTSAFSTMRLYSSLYTNVSRRQRVPFTYVPINLTCPHYVMSYSKPTTLIITVNTNPPDTQHPALSVISLN